MGGTGSKAVTSASVLNQIAIKATQKTITRCISVASQEQMLSIQGVSGNVSFDSLNMTQGISVDMKCLMSSEMQAAIQNQIATDIVQAVASTSEALIGVLGKSLAEAKTTVQNKLSMGVNQETIQESFTSSVQKQAISISDISGTVTFGNASMSQTASTVSENLIKNTSYASVINDIATSLNQAAAASQKNPLAEILDSFGGIFSSWVGLIIGIAVVGGLVFIIFIFFFFRSGVANTLGTAAAAKIQSS